MHTTIQISKEIKKKLDKIKLYQRESYNEIVERMIENETELTAKTKRELENAKKRINSGKGISHRIVKEKFADISRFNLIENTNPTDSTRSLTISWEHFDPGHGIELQVMYVSHDAANVSMDGVISGVQGFVDGRSLMEKSSRGIHNFLSCSLCNGLLAGDETVEMVAQSR